MTGFKGLVIYTIPKVDVQFAVTFRSVPGITNTNGAGAGGAQPSGLAANFVATNAYLAANSNLGRLLTGTTAADAEHDAADHQPRHRCISTATTSSISASAKSSISVERSRRSTSICTTC